MNNRHSEIVNLRKSGLTYDQIQNKIGCAKSTISWVLNKYIPEENSRIHRSSILNKIISPEHRQKLKNGSELYYANLRKEAKNS